MKTLPGNTEMNYDDFDTKSIVIMRKKDRINYILNGFCRYYNITMEEFMRRARTELRYKRKRLAVKVLRDVADCSLKDVKYAFTNKSEAAIWHVYDAVSEDLSPDSVGNEKLKKEYADILKFLGL
jgi:chromosomal replication initiation ATPase DnaA